MMAMDSDAKPGVASGIIVSSGAARYRRPGV